MKETSLVVSKPNFQHIPAMKLILFSVLSVLISSIQVFAQTTLNGAIRDGTAKPLPFASVALLNARDSTVAKGTASDASGLSNRERPR